MHEQLPRDLGRGLSLLATPKGESGGTRRDLFNWGGGVPVPKIGSLAWPVTANLHRTVESGRHVIERVRSPMSDRLLARLA